MARVKCEFCGKEFHKRPARIKRAKHHFCSQKCHYAGVHSFIELRTHKVCTDCREDKPISEYYPHKNGAGDQLSCYCKKCDSKRSSNFTKNHPGQRREYNRKYYHEHRDKIIQQSRASECKRIYGITIEQRNDILRKQNGICAICKMKPATDTDHDHITGRVRGMLCNTCNTALGGFQDNLLILLSAVRYLENNGN